MNIQLVEQVAILNAKTQRLSNSFLKGEKPEEALAGVLD